MPFIDPEAMIEVAPLTGWSGRFFHSTNMTFGQWEIAADANDLHQHHHEQEEVWNVVSGAILFVIDGTERRLDAGDAAVVPPSVSHAARVIGACRAIVVDYPVRLELPTRHSADRASPAPARSAPGGDHVIAPPRLVPVGGDRRQQIRAE